MFQLEGVAVGGWLLRLDGIKEGVGVGAFQAFQLEGVAVGMGVLQAWVGVGEGLADR